MKNTRRQLVLGSLALTALGATAQSSERPWPWRAVRLWVVYPPGGLSDSIARALSEPLSAMLGVPVVVEHRAGAGGSVGMAALARAAPDGHTLAFSAISPLTLQPLIGRVAYDPQHAFAPVAALMRTPVLVVGTPAFEGRDFTALIAQARQHPNAVRWATSGVATVGHLVLAQVRQQSGAAITHVPYQGGGPQLNDALAGQFEVLSTNVAAPQLRHVASGRLRALAVGAPSRLDALPEVPTLAELGFASANRDSLFGIFAPAATPAPVVQRLNEAFNTLLASRRIAQLLRQAHNLPAGGSPGDFGREIEADRALNTALVASGAQNFR